MYVNLVAVFIRRVESGTEMRDRAPAYRGPVLHFDALSLVALRKKSGLRKPSQQKIIEGGVYTRTCARILSLRSSLLLEHSLQPTPSPLCELA